MIVAINQASGFICPSAVAPSNFCLGDRCMAWRWFDREWAGPASLRTHNAADEQAIIEPQRPTNVPSSWTWCPYDVEDENFKAFWKEPDEQAAGRRRGYCGCYGFPKEVVDDFLGELENLQENVYKIVAG